MHRAFAVLACFILGSAYAYASSIPTVTVTSVGTGLTLQQAITNGLANAVQKVDGAVVGHQQLRRLSNVAASHGHNGSDLISQTYINRVIAASRGVVTAFVIERYGHAKPSLFAALRQSFDRLLGRPNPASAPMWVARLHVTVAQFRTSAYGERVRVAVFPPRALRISFDVLGSPVPSHVIANQLADEVQDYLVATNDLTVLDRRHRPGVQAGLRHIQSGAASPKNYALLGRTVGVDYVLVGTIRHLEYHLTHKTTMIRHHVYTAVSGEMSVSYRLIDAATEQVVLSSRHNARFSRFLPVRAIADTSAILHGDLMQISQAMGKSVVQYLHPMHILAAQGHGYIVDAGKGAIKVGQIYTVMRNGGDRIHPDKHGSLGAARISCCRILIKRVARHFAYGTLLPPAQTLSDFTATDYVLGPAVVQAGRHGAAQKTAGAP